MRKICSILLVLLLVVSVSASSGPKGYLALTFDDGPTGKVTELLLDGLAERGVKATFFLCGYRMEQFPDTLVHMAENGNEIGLHTYGHTYLPELSGDALRQDLHQCTDLLAEVTGTAPKLIRPPGGQYDAETLRVLASEGFPVILWSVDPEDWNTRDTNAVVRHLVSHARSGDILLLHDLYGSSVAAALQVVDRLQAEGYQFCTVSELAEISGTELKPGEVYRRFAPMN